jgi:D-serine deaminase-like pyridoxal phosphate-dependent protein
VAGYEGALAHDRSAAGLDRVRTYLERQVELHEALSGLYDDGEVYLTAGGSAYFDIVADVYGQAGAGAGQERPGVGSVDQVAQPGAGVQRGRQGAGSVTGRTRFVLRSGAYIVHDDGFYRQVSPFDQARPDGDWPHLQPAMHGLARVVSHPEPGLALLDGGKRDFPFDEGLPVPQRTAPRIGGPWSTLDGATISAMNDQHSFLRLSPAEAERGAAAIGSVVQLGLSHPCTAFDKWRLIPVVESAQSDRVIDLVRTFF